MNQASVRRQFPHILYETFLHYLFSNAQLHHDVLLFFQISTSAVIIFAFLTIAIVHEAELASGNCQNTWQILWNNALVCLLLVFYFFLNVSSSKEGLLFHIKKKFIIAFILYVNQPR